MRLAIAVLLMGMCACARKPEWKPDEWAKNPPVACSSIDPERIKLEQSYSQTGKLADGGAWFSGAWLTSCATWHVDFTVKKDDGAIQCFADPKHGREDGRLLAVDPYDPRVIVVALNDGCHQ